jgi:hypothetical protein
VTITLFLPARAAQRDSSRSDRRHRRDVTGALTDFSSRTEGPPCLALIASEASPRAMLPRLIATQWAGFVAIVLIQQHMAVRAKVFVGCNAGSTDGEKAHHTLLARSSRQLHGAWPSVSQHAALAHRDKPDDMRRLSSYRSAGAVLICPKAEC